MPQIRISRQVLDKNFISKVVGEPVADFMIRKGTDGTSSILSIDVRTRSGDILHIIYKSMAPVSPYGFPMSTPDLNVESPEAKFRSLSETYSIEILFYTKIVPAIEEIAKETLPIPKLFWAEDVTDEELSSGSAAFLVLEDLRPLGFKTGNKFKGLALPEVTLVMKAISKFHAQSYVLLQQNCTNLFTDAKSSVFTEKHPLTLRKGGGNIMTKFCERMYQDATNVLRKRRDPLIADKMLKFNGKVQETILRPWKQTDSKYFPVLNHGDLSVTNILFLYEGPGQPTDVKFIDFQKVYRSNIYDDLLFFFLSCTTPEFRTMHIKTCFEVYFESFSDVLKALDSPIPGGFSLRSMEKSYNENLDSGFCHFVYSIPFQLGVVIPPLSPATPCEGSRFDNFENPENSMSSEEYLNSVGDEFVAALENSERGVTRLYDVVDEMIHLNVL